MSFAPRCGLAAVITLGFAAAAAMICGQVEAGCGDYLMSSGRSHDAMTSRPVASSHIDDERTPPGSGQPTKGCIAGRCQSGLPPISPPTSIPGRMVMENVATVPRDAIETRPSGDWRVVEDHNGYSPPVVDGIFHPPRPGDF